MAERCKYSRERLKQIAGERGIYNTVDEIDASAVADKDLREIWLRIQQGYSELEDLLLTA